MTNLLCQQFRESNATKPNAICNLLTSLLKEWNFFLHPRPSPLYKDVNAYLFLYLVDGEYGFLDLILFLVNHFRLLKHASSSSLMAGTLMNHACNRVLTEKGKNLTLHNFLLFHLTKHVTA